MNETLHFRVSSGLKSIIGKELINDKYIAIFELVKNSYDAGAKNVQIKFENLHTENARIEIIDDGKGMNKDDIVNKWLFVAYSEKKNPSYRDKIKKRTYAGAKGVGRFSCDRLGADVALISKTKHDNIFHRIDVNWNDFEIDEKEDFVNIEVNYQTTSFKDIVASGTAIIISNLREDWDRNDLLALKRSLTQLVNPEATNQYDEFNIYLSVPSEIMQDEFEEEDRKRVNGVVKNYIFETLNLKTTKICVEIAEDGTYIQTSLVDRGTHLFTVREKNIYTLKNIKCNLYHLNRAAKFNFTKIMGTEVVNYGSVFVYKNGFRVYPYGESGQDFFEIDKRKAQGYNRFLGTREIVGRLEIYGEDNDLNETSSRNNGFIETYHLSELVDFFNQFVLRPLEKYVVNIIRWAEPINDQNEDSVILPTQLENLKNVISKIKPRTKESNIISIEYNKDLLRIIDERKNIGIAKEVDELKNIAIKKNDDELYDKAKKIEKQTQELNKRLKQSDEIRNKSEEKLDITEAQLTTTQRQVEILEARVDITADEAVSAMHIIKAYADAIDSTIQEVLEEMMNGNVDLNTITPLLQEIRQTCSKIKNSYNLVMNTNYSAESDTKKQDIYIFITTYIDSQWKNKLNIEVKSCEKRNILVAFNPLEFSIIIDNILNNSIKANATYIKVSFEITDTTVDIIFSDNGAGLERSTEETDRIFESGYTKTGGTGIGLATVKKYIQRIGGIVKCNADYSEGFQLIVRLEL